MLHSMLDPRYWNADLSMPLLKVRSAWLCDPRKLNTEEMGTQHMLSCTKERSYTGCRHSKILSVRWWIREIGYRLWRRALLQGGGCEGLLLGLGVGDSIPSALSRKFLSWTIHQEYIVSTVSKFQINIFAKAREIIKLKYFSMLQNVFPYLLLEFISILNT